MNNKVIDEIHFMICSMHETHIVWHEINSPSETPVSSINNIWVYNANLW